MAKKSAAILEFQKKYNVAEDEVWEVHGTTWVVKHKALERIAAEVGIVFDRPSVVTCDLANKIACICVFGKLGERSEWSFGEAAPANCKNSYPMAMAEKRAKDRVILKLLVCSGELYSSEDEIPEPEKRENPHVTRPSDVFDESDTENIPAPSPIIERLSKAKSNAVFAVLQDDLWRQGSHKEMKYWGQMNVNKIGTMHEDYQKILRGVYKEHWDAIADQETADEQRMAS